MTKCSFAPWTKTIFFWQCHLKAEGRSILEHPGVISWPKNLKKKLLCELRQGSFTATQKCNFCSISQHELFFLPWRKNPFQMTYTIWKVRLIQFFCLVLGSQPILIFLLNFFQCSGHYMVHIYGAYIWCIYMVQGLQNN